MTDSYKWPGKIVTEVVAASEFYNAEGYHQDYLQHCLQNSPLCTNKRYVDAFDVPKLASFRQQFPQLAR